ncbi:MAG: demethylmenaquinone methyltransferase / 2-methoxy-6-polyprenyl,4-benzoquinol methylase [Anaerophaga sp.]|uniref:bifunctional demethylmenaquinone methyltransferase/2-methoxy-6-polyprenyl-1,4-benzoquinol methylase UbiE n=1 Tax=Anaerophaga thermohalophila TaxID=177400 RepID=UPI000237C0E4|nr:bifunctional demethylmenaquinone methyltransferase/2-methoxy-6-polyprenyl-1,4-benzoquinol methylase UbiE [Anaerophaga thermohalophila]MDK2840897.1 demethylmenaquinone methyltransferase / 2-methoxy-6-polyprenyl,4-benzoquinol methylase [Anaerophaga sp.]
MVKPYKNLEGSKKEQVRTMFNRIAPRYDLLNHLLSFGIDNIWRKNVVKQLRELKAPLILDVATGTGDLAIQIAKIDPIAVYALDLSEEMLAIAREKIEKRRLHTTIQLKHGDSEELPFGNNFFDAATVAFGVRNFENLQKGLSEIHRVLRQDGRLVVLEFSRPKKFPLKQLYHFYITRILPWWGGIISHDKDAYSYLPESALQFPDGKDFTKELQKAGFESQKILPQTFGVATIYVAIKK